MGDLPDTETLLAQMGWVRQLASRLVADPNQAEDVAQDAMAAALARGRGAPAGVPIRAWLGGVVRNLVRQDRRTSARRIAREQRAARGESEPGTEELVERWAVHRQLVDSVEALEEPYREALLMRYFEGLPPREIASRLGVPVKTVKTRLARALERLRARLMVHYERDGRDWLAALLPLARIPVGQTALATTTTLGALAVNSKLLVFLIAVALGGSVAGVYWARANPGVEPVVEAFAPRHDDSVAASGPERPLALDGDRPERSPVTSQARGAGESEVVRARTDATAARELRLVRGRVLDADSRPVAGVELRWRGGGPALDLAAEEIESKAPDAGEAARGAFSSGGVGELARGTPVRTDATGIFGFHTDRGGALEARAEAWVTVLAGSVQSGSSIEPIVVVAPSVPFGGRVVDEAGRPVDSVPIRFVLPHGFEARFSRSLEGSQRMAWTTRSDADGRFWLDGAPDIPGSELRADAEGYRTAVAPLPDGATDALLLVLERHTQADGTLVGEVIDDAGRRVPGARVSLGAFSTLTNQDGQFVVDVDLAVATERILAIKAGHRAGSLIRPGDPGGPNGGWPNYVVLELGGPPLTITGRVLGFDGEPQAGVQVWVHDSTTFGLLGGVPATLEGLAAGAPVRRSPGPEAEELAAAIRRGDYLDYDSVPEEPSAGWNWAETDARGRFRIEGLMPRAYTLRVLDPTSLVMEELEGVSAGASDVEIALSDARVQKEIQGRVVSRGGVPLAGVRVSALTVPERNRLVVDSATFDSRLLRVGPSTLTDADGRFRFEGLPRDGLHLSLRGDSILPERIEIDADDLDDELRLEVAAKCQVEVALQDPGRADRVAFRDRDGEPVFVYVIRGASVGQASDHALVEGRSGVIAVEERAVELVLSKGGEEVAVHPIGLRPGSLQELRP